MAKKRVYEIARERGLQTQQVMRRLKAAGVEVKAAASTVDDETIEKVFGTREPSVSPSQSGSLPSWLSAGAGTQPKTRSVQELEEKKREQQEKADKAKAARERAMEKARELKRKALEQRRKEAEAARKAKEKAEREGDAAATEDVDPEPVPEPAPEPTAEETPAAEADPTTEAAEPAEAAAPETPAEPAAPRGPKVISSAAPPAEPAPTTAPADDGLEQRVAAQQLAQKRASELAARRRAQLQAQKLEEQTRARLRKDKDKDKKDSDATEAPEDDSGRRSPAPSRVPLVSRDGGARGPGGKRRVIIDSAAGRKGAARKGKSAKAARRDKKRQREEIDLSAPVEIHAGATVKELADALSVAPTEIIKVMMQLGEMVTITQSLSDEQMEIVAEELERNIEIRSAADEEELPVFEDAPEDLAPRPPVVTIMGHVDHGKTSLLDALRETNVAEGEAGGITQHIGAYQVEMGDGRAVTVLDTPGHEAFTALRARGAKVTDVAVLVVAADDGVQPQTREAIDHARAAEVPIVVAVNKIDKDNAQPERVKGELAELGLQPEAWGGDTVTVEVSALKRQNLDELVELLLLQADLLELKANASAEASGYVIESKLDPGRGPVATVLVARGTLKVGDVVAAGDAWGKVRAMNDYHGTPIDAAGPAVPVEVLGFNSVPTSGEFCMVVENERVARDKASKRSRRLRAEELARRQKGLTLDDFYSRVQEGKISDLNVIIKADVAGSIEAIEQELSNLEHDEVRVQIIRSGVGGITGSDVMLASASEAIILGFNVRPNAEARDAAQREGVDVRTYSVIYKLREDIEQALSGLLSPEEIEESTGEAEVRQTFRASRIGTIAGCYVTNGTLTRGSRARLVRDGRVVHDGRIGSLRRFQEDTREVQQGYECGVSLEGFNDVKEGDVIETYAIREVERDVRKEFAST